MIPGAPLPDEFGLRDVDAHRDFLLDSVASLQPFGVGLHEAAGLTLCEAIEADLDLPTFTAATTDGWAVRTANLVGASERMPIVLPVVGQIDQATYRGATLAAGTAVKVAAGAPIPAGADAVMPTEAGLVSGRLVQFVTEAELNQFLVLAGSRVTDGERLLEPGIELTPRNLAQIAELGNDKVLARPRPRVVVLTVGDDLVEPGRPLARLSQHYDSCTTLLATTARNDGAQVFTAGPVPAELKSLGNTLSEQLVRADLVLLIAEINDDLIELLAEQGAIDVAEVDLLPERQVFALIGPDRTPVLVLPPDPVEAYLTYNIFGQALVRRLAGLEDEPLVALEGELTQEVLPDPERPKLVLARHANRLLTPIPAGGHGAVELALATSVFLLPPDEESYEVGTPVPFWVLP